MFYRLLCNLMWLCCQMLSTKVKRTGAEFLQKWHYPGSQKIRFATDRICDLPHINGFAGLPKQDWQDKDIRLLGIFFKHTFNITGFNTRTMGQRRSSWGGVQATEAHSLALPTPFFPTLLLKGLRFPGYHRTKRKNGSSIFKGLLQVQYSL